MAHFTLNLSEYFQETEPILFTFVPLMTEFSMINVRYSLIDKWPLPFLNVGFTFSQYSKQLISLLQNFCVALSFYLSDGVLQREQSQNILVLSSWILACSALFWRIFKSNDFCQQNPSPSWAEVEAWSTRWFWASWESNHFCIIEPVLLWLFHLRALTCWLLFPEQPWL